MPQLPCHVFDAALVREPAASCVRVLASDNNARPWMVTPAAPGATLAIGAQETVALWSEGSAEPCANRTACLEFQVEDVDADYARLKDRVSLVHELKTMPWGNRTFQFRDPEGTAVSLYMPATEAAKARFAAR